MPSPSPSPLGADQLTTTVGALPSSGALPLPGGASAEATDLAAAAAAFAVADPQAPRLDRNPLAALGLALAIADWSGKTGAIDLSTVLPKLPLTPVRLVLPSLPGGQSADALTAAVPPGLTLRPGSALLLAGVLSDGRIVAAVADPARQVAGHPRLELAILSATTLAPLLALAGASLDPSGTAITITAGTAVPLIPIDPALATRLVAGAGVLFVDQVPLQPKGAKLALTVDPIVPATPADLAGVARVSQAKDGRVLALNAAGTAVGRAQYIGGTPAWDWRGKDGLALTLRELADRIGWRVGVEMTGYLFSQASWQTIVRAQFNQALLSWGLNWNEVEPERGRFDFSVMDRLVAFAQSNAMRVRADSIVFGHTSMLPSWVVQGHFSAAQLAAILQEHVRAVVSQYRGAIGGWVVANEPYIAPYSTDDFFYRTFGYDYIDLAFAAAREADPAAALNFSDTSNHTAAGITTNLTLQTVARLKAKGLIDIVGLQMHLDGANPPDPVDVRDTMRRYGLPVAVTSLDIDLSNVPGSTAQRYAVQAQIAASMLRAARDSGVCRDFSVWGIGDGVADSWLQRPGAPAPAATPFDGQLRPKPFFQALLAGFA
jgi:endo-1,4-beta-xylanase